MNKVILMGRLTRDPDVRYSQTANGSMAVARYTLAVDRRFKKDGETNADFISCVAFGKVGEFAESKAAAEQNGVNTAPARPKPSNVDADGFMTIPDNVDDDGLPF